MSLNGYGWVEGNTPNNVDPSGMIPKSSIENICLSSQLVFQQLQLQNSEDLSTWTPPVENPVYAGGNRYGRNECPTIDYYDCNAIRLATGSCRNPDGSPLARDCQCCQSNGDPVPDRFVIHPGSDFSTNRTRIYAVADATIERLVFSNEGYGNHVILAHDNGLYTLYAHLSSFEGGFYYNYLIDENYRIRQGAWIGTSGSTGRSTADHLHFEIKREVRNFQYPRSPEELAQRFITPATISGIGASFGEEPIPYPVDYRITSLDPDDPNSRNCCPQECCSRYATR